VFFLSGDVIGYDESGSYKASSKRRTTERELAGDVESGVREDRESPIYENPLNDFFPVS
jgi:hypothetical protein